MPDLRLAVAAVILAGTAYAPAASAATCPSQDFPAFLDIFMKDVAVQQAFTARPLQSVSIDATAEPEPKPVTRMLDKPVFPVMSDAQKQRRDGLRRTVSAQPGGDIEVKLAGTDGDYQVRYLFRKAGCWQLYRIEDDSL